MKHIYEYTAYKNYLKARIEQMPQKGAVSLLAAAAGCDRTYLSQVLNSKVQLTADHAFGIAAYFDLQDPEQDYFLMLVLLDRASNQQAKKIIKRKLEKIVKENTLVSKKIHEGSATQELTDQQKSIYYTDAIFSFVHTLVGTKDYQTVESLIEKTLQKKDVILKCIDQLLEMGLIFKKGAYFQHSQVDIHVPRGSAYNKMNHFNWRIRAVETSNRAEDVHYTNLFSISKEDWIPFKLRLLEFLEQQRKEIRSSGSEEVYCFCCDLFTP